MKWWSQQCMLSPHTSYRWRGDEVMKPIRVCSHHTPATGGEETEWWSQSEYALTTHQLQVERRWSDEANQSMLSPHTSYRWRGDEVMKPIRVCSHHTPATGGEETEWWSQSVYALTTHQLQVERRWSDEANQSMLSPHTSYRWRGDRVMKPIRVCSHHTPATGGKEMKWWSQSEYALTTHQLQVERRWSDEANQSMLSPHTSYRWRRDRVMKPISVWSHHTPATGGEETEWWSQSEYALTTHQLQVERRWSDEANQSMLSPRTSYRWRRDRVMKPISVWGWLGGHDGQRSMGEFGQDTVTARLLFEGLPGIFNDHRESGPWFNVSSERHACWQYSVPIIGPC